MTDDFETRTNAARAAIGKPPVAEYVSLVTESAVAWAFSQAVGCDLESAQYATLRNYWLGFANGRVQS